METVALEWISCLEVEPRDVVQFVQQLNNVPEDAVCEVGDIFSQRCRSTHQGLGNQDVRRIRNEVHLSCELRVAEFLCKKFSKQKQHVTGGEVICVRCKRVYPGAAPRGKLMTAIPRSKTAAGRGKENDDGPQFEVDPQASHTFAAPAPVLPIDKVIALIDLLGDQVVDAQEAYELFAESDARPPQRMTMLGLTKALGKLRQNEWTARPKARRRKDEDAAGPSTKISVEGLRHLISKLITSDNVALRRLPSSPTEPFLSYTDFLACYVAFLANFHPST